MLAQPARRRNPAVLVLGILIGLTVLAGIGLVAAAVLAQPATTPYANDDYQAPPPDAYPPGLPSPASAQQAVDWTLSNAIYPQRIPTPVRCEVPRIAAGGASDAELVEHFDAMLICLLRVWDIPATQAGFTLVRPKVYIFGDGDYLCGGNQPVGAFYCPRDQQVYFSRLYPQRAANLQKTPWGVDITMAHEFGHAIQARTGILSASDYLERRSTTDEQLRFSRRTEAQADCFSGLFLRSVSRSIGLPQSDLPAILDSFVAKGADVTRKDPNVVGTHPHGVNRRYWGQMGMSTAAIADCNAYAADPQLVR